MKVHIDLLCKNLAGDTPPPTYAGDEVDDGNASEPLDSTSFVHIRYALGGIRDFLDAFCHVVDGEIFFCHTDAGKRHMRGKVHLFFYHTESYFYERAFYPNNGKKWYQLRTLKLKTHPDRHGLKFLRQEPKCKGRLHVAHVFTGLAHMTVGVLVTNVRRVRCRLCGKTTFSANGHDGWIGVVQQSVSEKLTGAVADKKILFHLAETKSSISRASR